MEISGEKFKCTNSLTFRRELLPGGVGKRSQACWRRQGRFTHHVFVASPFPSRFVFYPRELREWTTVLPGLGTLGPAFISSFNIEGGREGPQLCTWPQGSTPVQTVIKYLEVEEKSDQELRGSTLSLGDFPLMSTSRWPSGRYPSSLSH